MRMTELMEVYEMEELVSICEMCEYYDKEESFCKVCFCNDELCDFQIEELRKRGK